MHSTICFVVLSLFFFPSSCTQCLPRPLGMENGDILDSKITASSQYDGNHGPTNGRLNFVPTGGKTGAWSASTNNGNQWLQVDLGVNSEVTGVQTQGRGGCACSQWVTSYTVSYSNDGTTFTDYTQNGQVTVFAGNNDKTTVITQSLSPAINARYIRVNPKTYSEFISLRMELLGCRRKELPSSACAFMSAGGFCGSPDYQERCPTQCPPPSTCSNYMPDAGCNVIKDNRECDKQFPVCRKACSKCDIDFASVGCFIDVNSNRNMATFLHADYADANLVNVCAQKASARGFSMFGVEAGGQCFSGVDAEFTFKKHGQAPDADCINGKGASFRMSVYKFV